MPGATTKRSVEWRKLVEEVAEEQRLAVLLQADHRVELGGGLVRKHRLQEGDVGRRHLHVDEEVRAVRREQQRELESDRSAAHRRSSRPSRPCLIGHGERQHLQAVDDAPDDVGGAVAEERAVEDLDLQAGGRDERPRRAAAERAQHVAKVAAEILEAAASKRRSSTMSISACRSPLAARIVAAVGRRIGVEVLGRHRRPHEQEAVVEVACGAGACTTPS